MAHKTMTARQLAVDVLELLDRGDLAAARMTLKRVARSHAEDSVEHSGYGLAQSAAACMVGVGWPGSAADRYHSQPPGSWFDLTATDAPAFNSGVLKRLKETWTSSPARLLDAAECLRLAPTFDATIAIPLMIEGANVAEVLPRHSAAGSDRAESSVKVFLSSALQFQAARQRISERVTFRLVYWANGAGMTQREISQLIAKPQTHISRSVQAVREDPAAFALSPDEIYQNHLTGQIDRRALIELLAAYPYQQGAFPSDAPEWGYVPGSWDQLIKLVVNGSISDEELDVIVAGHEMVMADRE